MAPPDAARQLRLAPDLGHGRANATPAGRGRKKDEDTNVTDRDVAALTWLGEQYGARADVLRVLLARLGVQGEGQLGERTLRQITERWAETGLATRHRLLGHQWVVPTGKALHLVGLGFKPWSPVVTQLNHIHAVGIVRLALEQGTDANLAIPDGGRWISERELRRDRTVTASVAGSAKDRPPRTKDYDAWTAIRARHPQVPEVVLVVAAGSDRRARGLTLGHFAAGRWELASYGDNTTVPARRPEVLVGGEGLRRGAVDVLGTLLHEAAHGLAYARRIQDTSRQGRFHNRRYAVLAGELGLDVAQADGIGWSAPASRRPRPTPTTRPWTCSPPP